MSKNVFITGAAGFIGYHLASFLKARGDEVLGLDNFNSYYSTELKRARAKELARRGIQVVEGDINDSTLVEQCLCDHHATHIVHLAAQAGVRYALVSPESYVHSNVNGFFHILEVCRRHPHLKLTYASSSSVYGNNTKIPFSVGDRTDHQASFYGVTKKSNELMAQNYHHLFGLSVTGLRFFTAYGPWGRPDMAYFSFTESIFSERTLDVYDEGRMMRDFTYIDDIVEGAAAAIDLESRCEIFNLGNNHPVKVMEMIHELEALCGKRAKMRFLPLPSGDVPITYADISYSQKMLNFKPKTPLKEGLNHFMKWYKLWNNNTFNCRDAASI